MVANRGAGMAGPPISGEAFVSEGIVPEPGSFDASAMSRGEPGLPGAFTWRGRRFQVAQVLSSWKTSTRERGELYLRRHWHEVLVASGERMTVYCERQARNRARPKARWWLYKVNA
jgi:hypothetical protein